MSMILMTTDVIGLHNAADSSLGAASVGGLYCPSFATAFLARRRIDFVA